MNDEQLLSLAIDEIYILRRALAYEASVTDAHLGYATFPKGRREVAEAQIARMRQAARGGVGLAYVDRSWMSLRASLIDAGARETLTNSAWIAEHAGSRDD
jgi:hypothetical protein